jgi:hypothetical protein
VIADGVSRVRVERVLADGTVEVGSALLIALGHEWSVSDFRDADGAPWPLPPGARYDVDLPFSISAPSMPRRWWRRLLDAVPWR